MTDEYFHNKPFYDTNPVYSNNKIYITHLDYHISHACNLACKGCAHFSDYNFSEILSIDKIKHDFSFWSSKIKPRRFNISGGEPLLNKDLYEILYLVKNTWDYDYIAIQTNALLLYRFPELGKILSKLRCFLHVSTHSVEKKYLEKLKPNLEILKQWKKDYNINVKITQSHKKWLNLFSGWGESLEPSENNDYIESWNNCPTGQDCFQLKDNEIYKCVPLAYLPMVKKKFPNLSSKWDKYLAYKPLNRNATDEEIIKFFRDTLAEPVCSMCSPLIRLEKYTKSPFLKDVIIK